MTPEREAGTFEQFADSMGFRAHGKSREYCAAKAAWELALKVGAEAQRERDAQFVQNAMIPESFRKCQNYTEFERGGDNYLAQVAQAIRSAPIEGEK